jgi:hypothetical protein
MTEEIPHAEAVKFFFGCIMHIAKFRPVDALRYMLASYDIFYWCRRQCAILQLFQETQLLLGKFLEVFLIPTRAYFYHNGFVLVPLQS